MKILLLTVIVAISGCTSLSPVTSGPSIWCNTPYLTGNEFDGDHLDIAQDGYIYSLAASLALKNDPPWFHAHERLVKVDNVHRWSGMEATTYELRSYKNHETIDEIIIAYAGSNSTLDWLFTNLPLGLAPTHYRHAREYALSIVDQYKEKSGSVDIVVTGASLGGGISINVLKHESTSDYIDKAWVFNSSPKTKVNDETDIRLWAASMKDEFLYPIRNFFDSAPLLTGIGVHKDQYQDGYYLVESNRAFQHYNYVLTRNLLHAAIPALKRGDHSPLVDEPEKILLLSNEARCKSPKYMRSSRSGLERI
jgi:hypothetical protein